MRNRKRIQPVTFLALSVLLSFVVIACGGDDDSTLLCSPGETRTCNCASDGDGLSTCAQDGLSWGDCSGCGSIDGDSDSEQMEQEGESGSPFGFPSDHPLMSGEFMAIAHRGGGKLAPEETMPAYENAVALGIDMLEMDLHATKDGVIVLHHDGNVDRTTDGTGNIRDMTFEEVRALDSGYQFTADGGQTFPYRGQGVQVATFKEVLQAFPEMLFSAELKQSDPSIVDAVLAVLDETGMSERVILVSFSDETVREVREKRPDIVTGAGLSEMMIFGTLTDAKEADYVPPCPIFQLSDIDADSLARAHRLGLQVQIWTVNDEVSMRSWLEMGVDAIMTDDPALLMQVIEETP